LTTKPGGTGIGLPLIKRLVEEGGGRITVESRVGVGTTFTIRFPAVAPNAAPALSEPPSGGELNGPAPAVTAPVRPPITSSE